MLQDILNSFHQVVTRSGRRPNHPGGRASAERIPREKVVVRVEPSRSNDHLELPSRAHDDIPEARITPAPGPGEVVPPGWW